MTTFTINGQHVIHFAKLPVKTTVLLDVLVLAHTGIAAMKAMNNGDDLGVTDGLAESLSEFTETLQACGEAKELNSIMQAIQLTAESLHADFNGGAK